MSLFILLLFLFGRPNSKKTQGSVISNQSGVKFNGIVLQLSSKWCHISRWRPCHHFTQKSAAIWWVHAEHLPGAYAAASSSSWNTVHS